MFLKITVPGIFLKSKIFSHYNTKILGAILAQFHWNFCLLLKWLCCYIKIPEARLRAPGNRTPLKNYDFKFYIKIYWFLSSILYDFCFFSSSSKSLENEKYKRYISVYVYYLYCRSFFMVDLWNNYIWFANNISKRGNLNIIFIYINIQNKI